MAKKKKKRPKNVFAISLGCAKNLVDSEVMLGVLAEAGYELTDEAAEADFLLVNTCSFIADAREEAEEVIDEMAAVKEETGAKLVVTGCYPQQDSRKLAREFPEIDVLAGVTEYSNIAEILQNASRGGRKGTKRHIKPPDSAIPSTVSRLRITPAHYSYLKIADGCDHACSFCTIPKIKGRSKSRDIEELVGETEALAASGARELMVIAQDIAAYAGRGGLAGLLERMATEIDLLRWIRLLYLYPTRVDDRLLETVEKYGDVILPYFDIPLQHASEKILRAMKRPGNTDSYRGLVQKIRSAFPDAALRTTFIVGFPGETAEDFDKLLAFAKEMEFDHVGAFAYSDEKGTAAQALPGKVPPDVVDERLERLMLAQQEISFAKLKKLIGGRVDAVCDGYDGGKLVGRLWKQAVDIDGLLFIEGDGIEPGDFFEAEIINASHYDVIGRKWRDRSPEKSS